MAMNDPVTRWLVSETGYAAGPLDDHDRVKTGWGLSLCRASTSSMTAATNSSVVNFIFSTRFLSVGQTVCCFSVHLTATGWATRYVSDRAFLAMRLTNG